MGLDTAAMSMTLATERDVTGALLNTAITTLPAHISTFSCFLFIWLEIECIIIYTLDRVFCGGTRRNINISYIDEDFFLIFHEFLFLIICHIFVLISTMYFFLYSQDIFSFIP